MKIALIQQHATTDKKDNRRRGYAAIEKSAQQGAELIVFAELAFEPFWPQERGTAERLENAEPIPGETTDKLCELARKHNVLIVPNLFERDGAKTYDTSIVIERDGRILGKTRMMHIPDYACFHERDYYQPGDSGAPVYDTSLGKIGIAICYDRHYPEYMRQLSLKGAELVLVPQAGAVGEWPDGLYEAEMQVAAFQNGYFVALCNRVGKEPKLHFAGESFICAPSGEVLARAASKTDDILFCEFELSDAAASHAQKLFLADRRPDVYKSWI